MERWVGVSFQPQQLHTDNRRGEREQFLYKALETFCVYKSVFLSHHSSDNEFRPNFGNTELFYFSDFFFFRSFLWVGRRGRDKKKTFSETQIQVNREPRITLSSRGAILGNRWPMFCHQDIRISFAIHLKAYRNKKFCPWSGNSVQNLPTGRLL